MNMPISRIGLWSTTMLAAATLAACGGGGGSGGGASTPTGTLGVSLTDAPACGFDAVNVTVSKVRAHQSATASDTDAGWSDITLSPARKINLLNLSNGALESLGETPLAAGHYTQLRLVLDGNAGNALANSVVATGTTTEVSLDTPSAVQSGIKLIKEFDVVSGQRVDLVLDFNACKSVVSKGNGKYALKPVVKVIPTLLNGISGFVNKASLASHVLVSAQQNGVVVASTTPNAAGEFFLARLVPGNYDVVITADASATAVVAGVPIAGGSSTVTLSTVGAPITLAPSLQGSIGGTVTRTPASAIEVSYLSAKQTFAAGPTVTVKYQGADIATGAYTLANLPLAAPQLTVYTTALPLSFSAALTTTPGTAKYRMEAATTGYANASIPSVDVSLVNQTNVNFSLVP